MIAQTRFEDTCQVTCEDNGKVVEADVLDFKEGKSLSVSLHKSVKLVMSWNGRIYEANGMGLSFVSSGPNSQKYMQGTR